MAQTRLDLIRRIGKTVQLTAGVSVTGACIWLMAGHLETATLDRLGQNIANLNLLQLCGAAALCLLSFWAVGRYDTVAHRHLGTGVGDVRARISGTIAVALAQTLGFGLFTGALARWRMLPDLCLPTAMRLSAFVSLSFIAGWACVTALVCLVFPAPAWTLPAATIVLVLVPVCLVLLFWHPSVLIGRWHLRLPSLTACTAILCWTAVDTSAAAGALWLLIPAQDLTFTSLFPIFLIALGAALLTGTPGGVGPFELSLLTLLPHVPPVDLLAGIVVFRLIYYAGPAILAMIAMLRPLSVTPVPSARPLPPMRDAHRSEIGVMHQNMAKLIPFRRGAAVAWPTGQTLTALFDPIAGQGADMLPALQAAATARNSIACLYKCTARTALAARRIGWHVTHIADEAVFVPARFDLQTPPRRGLRRKLRHAQKAKVRIASPPHDRLPFPALAEIDAAWLSQNGTARGGTMGRYSPDYLSRQRVFIAYQDARPIAFVSFHHSDRQWCLDLMRSTPDMPDGTMHALICAALSQAAAEGIPALSLAATPACPDPSSRWMRALSRQISARSGGPGLRQFKSSFAPRWQPLYAAASTVPALALALADIARAVHRPSGSTCVTPHEQDEYNELALRKAS